MKPHRRYLAFSLRTLFVVLTASAVWLGVVVHRAREQREAVKAIKALGGGVFYDWQLILTLVVGNQTPPPKDERPHKPPGPEWLRRLVGNEFFQRADQVTFATSQRPSDEDILKAIPHIQRLRDVKVILVGDVSDDTLNKMRAALPHCEIEELWKSR